MTVSHFICSLSVDSQWGIFYPLAILNNAAKNIHIQVSSERSIFIFLGYIPRNGISAKYINSNSMFNVLRSSQAVFLCMSFYISTSHV